MMPQTKPHLVTSCRKQTDDARFYTFENLPAGHEKDTLLAVEIGGDSLERAGIPQNYIAAVVKDRAVSSGDLVAGSTDAEPDDLIVRYVFFGPGGWMRLQTADRDEYPDLIYAPGGFHIVGPVVHAEPMSPCSPQLNHKGF